jgi:demethylmenaquinone methyltransferase / 2-methoxy-6-polyprenyl-1,4-benzoquinol methylase
VAVTALPTGEDKAHQVRAMFDVIAPRYELVNHLMTLGLDRSWRRRAIRDMYLPPGSEILDLASGTGDFAREALRQGHHVTGADFSIGMLQAAHGVFPRVQGDALSLPFSDGCFDGVTCGYGIRNFTELAPAFAEMARVLRPGGRISILEVAEPKTGLLRAAFRVWFRQVVPQIGAALSDSAAYQYLPDSVAYLPGTTVIRTMLCASGFSAVNHRLVLSGLSQLFVATRSWT